MLGETKNQFSLTRAALEYLRAHEKQIPISKPMLTERTGCSRHHPDSTERPPEIFKIICSVFRLADIYQ